MVVCPALLLLYGSFLKIAYAQQDCTWDVNSRSQFPQVNPPLIIETLGNKLVLPKVEANGKIIRIGHNVAVTMSCPGSNFNFHSTTIDIRVTCSSGSLFKLPRGANVKPLSMSNMGCAKEIVERVTRPDDDDWTYCGGPNSELFGIGFDTKENSDDHFYTQIGVCFDQNKETTFWTDHTLHGANIKAHYQGSVRPTWKAKLGIFSTRNMDKVYTLKAQSATFAIVRVQPGNDYFARGHLAPNADFVTKSEMDATFQLINVVPQWQGINNGNWATLEERIRKLAAHRRTDLRIITGSSTNNVLKDTGNNPMYLEDIVSNTAGFKRWPIPQATWKIVIDKSSNEGIAFVVSNEPWKNPKKLTSNQKKRIQASKCETNALASNSWFSKTVGGKVVTAFSDDKGKGNTACFSISTFKKLYKTIQIPDDLDDATAMLIPMLDEY